MLNVLAAKVRGVIRSHERQIRDIRAELFDYAPHLKALCGAIVHLDYQGELTVARGLIRQRERDAVAQAMRSDDGDDQTKAGVDLPPVMTRPVHSEVLTNRLQSQRVIALQAEIMARPTLALCLLIEQMLDRLGEVVGLDMSKWWKPTSQTYLAHVSKDRIAAVVTEAVDAEQAKPLLAMKKAQAAAAAERLLEGKGWVPEMMRTQTLQVEMAVEHPMGEIEE